MNGKVLIFYLILPLAELNFVLTEVFLFVKCIKHLNLKTMEFYIRLTKYLYYVNKRFLFFFKRTNDYF